MSANDKGWGKPVNAKKWHYFDTGPESLCGGWLYVGSRDDDAHDHPDNCKVCCRKLQERQAALAAKSFGECAWRCHCGHSSGTLTCPHCGEPKPTEAAR